MLNIIQYRVLSTSVVTVKVNYAEYNLYKVLSFDHLQKNRLFMSEEERPVCPVYSDIQFDITLVVVMAHKPAHTKGYEGCLANYKCFISRRQLQQHCS